MGSVLIKLGHRQTVSTTKVAITIDEMLLARLDRLVERKLFPNRSKAIQAAVQDKLARLDRTPLARERANLNAANEKALAEEGMDWRS